MMRKSAPLKRCCLASWYSGLSYQALAAAMSGNWAMVTLSAGAPSKTLFSVDGEERRGVGGACRGRLRSVTVEFRGIRRLFFDEDHIGWHRGIPVLLEGG